MSRTSENILFLRREGLTQVEIAKRTGLPQCRLSRWENGGVPRAADDAIKLDELARELRAAAATPDLAESKPNPPRAPASKALAASNSAQQGAAGQGVARG